MPKPLTFETFLAALTVVGAAACSRDKAAPGVSAEALPPPMAASAAPSSPPAPAAAAPPAATTSPEPAVGASEVPSPKAKPRTTPRNAAPPKGNAACGAGTCSDEMKK